MALKQIDQDTVQPDGKRGLPGRSAFGIVNENAAETELRVAALETGSGGTTELVVELQERLASELQARTDADVALGERIEGEQAARLAADAEIAIRLVGKNRLINGDLRFWQRGSAFTVNATNAIYTADRFQVGCVNAGSVAVSRQQFAPAFDGAMNFIRCVVTGATAQTTVFFGQPIEGVQVFAGKKVTFKFLGWADTEGKKVGVRLIQDFGAGGSTAVVSYTAAVLLGSGASYREVTMDVPSIAGKTVGANSKLFVLIDLSSPTDFGGQLAGQTGAFNLSLLQIEEGSATGFEFRPYGQELQLCQRYYEKSYDTSTAPGTSGSQVPGAVGVYAYGLNTSQKAAGCGCAFKVSKRSTPAVTVFSPETGAAGKVQSLSSNSDIAANLAFIGTAGFFCYGNDTGARDNYNLYWHWAADAEL